MGHALTFPISHLVFYQMHFSDSHDLSPTLPSLPFIRISKLLSIALRNIFPSTILFLKNHGLQVEVLYIFHLFDTKLTTCDLTLEAVASLQ